MLASWSVQRRWTKNIEGMQGLSYMQRLNSLSVLSIRGRVLQLDLSIGNKICLDSEGFDLSVLFWRSELEVIDLS